MKFSLTAVYAITYNALSSDHIVAESENAKRNLRTKRKLPLAAYTGYTVNQAYWSTVEQDTEMSMSMSMPGGAASKDFDFVNTRMVECQGNCAEDDDCAGNLRCFDRNSNHATQYDPVPGCESTFPEANGDVVLNYCYDATGLLVYVHDNSGMLAVKDQDKKLDECQGDCDKDDDCAEGLICGKRNTGDPIPEDCTNPYEEISVWYRVDFCCNPTKADCNPLSVELTDLDNNLGSASYEACQGDCDDDDDCVGVNTRCFQRGDDAPLLGVPGCTGQGTAGADYCFNADGYLWEVAYSDNIGDATVPYADKDGGLTITGLFECQGDCDDDDDCSGHLRCFDRDDSDNTQNDPVPGCLSSYPGVEGVSGMDYCYDPTGLLVYVYENGEMFANKDQGKKLGNCQGDCDYDDDCAEGLICGQRMTGDPIPEDCTNPYKEIGVWWSVDFCCNSTKAGCLQMETE